MSSLQSVVSVVSLFARYGLMWLVYVRHVKGQINNNNNNNNNNNLCSVLLENIRINFTTGNLTWRKLVFLSRSRTSRRKEHFQLRLLILCVKTNNCRQFCFSPKIKGTLLVLIPLTESILFSWWMSEAVQLCVTSRLTHHHFTRIYQLSCTTPRFSFTFKFFLLRVSVLLTPSSVSIIPTAFPPQHVTCLYSLISCLMKCA